MKTCWRRAARVLVPALLLPLWSCGDDKTTIIQGGSGELGGDQSPTTPTQPEPDPLRYTLGPEVIRFDHLVRVDDCPQRIATLTVENTGEDVLRFELRSPGAARPILLDPASGSVAQGKKLEVKVFFDCSTQDAFSRILTFTVENVRTGFETVSTVAVFGTIIG